MQEGWGWCLTVCACLAAVFRPVSIGRERGVELDVGAVKMDHQ